MTDESDCSKPTGAWVNIPKLKGPGQTLFPRKDFYPINDAQALYNAMKGLGTDEDTISNILGRRSADQRVQIAEAFMKEFGKGETLAEFLESECTGNYEKICLTLLEPLAKLDAREIHRAVRFLSTRDGDLIEVLATRTKTQLDAIKVEYLALYNETLEDAVKGDTSGDYQTAMLSLCQGRDECNGENDVDRNKVQQDASDLYVAGERRPGTDEEKFIEVLTRRSAYHIRLVDEEYRKRHGKTMAEIIEAEFSFHLKACLLACVDFASDPAGYWAKRIIRCGKGFGTEDYDLIRIIVSRCEYDLNWVRTRFPEFYDGKTLGDFLRDETSGDYQDMLMILSSEAILDFF